MDVPKGKISVVVAWTLLKNHKLSPQTWTAEKIAKEYYLELKDIHSILKYVVTFEVKNPPSWRKESNTTKMKKIIKQFPVYSQVLRPCFQCIKLFKLL